MCGWALIGNHAPGGTSALREDAHADITSNKIDVGRLSYWDLFQSGFLRIECFKLLIRFCSLTNSNTYANSGCHYCSDVFFKLNLVRRANTSSCFFCLLRLIVFFLIRHGLKKSVPTGVTMFWTFIEISFLRSVFEYDTLGWPSCCSGPISMLYQIFFAHIARSNIFFELYLVRRTY
jgi:hypothetical protein